MIIKKNRHLIHTFVCEGTWSLLEYKECISIKYTDIELKNRTLAFNDAAYDTLKTKFERNLGINISLAKIKHRNDSKLVYINKDKEVYFPILSYIDTFSTAKIKSLDDIPSYHFNYEFFTNMNKNEYKYYELHTDKTFKVEKASKWLSKEQLTLYKRKFNTYDRNSNGYINIKDLWGLMKECNENPTTNELLDITKNIDSDKVNEIDFIEFQAIMANRIKIKTIEKRKLDKASKNLTSKQIEDFRRAFNNYDINKDGHISANELTAVLRSLDQYINHDEINDLIAKSDVDNDGLLDFSEFLLIAGHKQRRLNKRQQTIILANEHLTREQIKKYRNAFDLYDMRRDGTISTIELESLMKSLDEKPTKDELRKIINEATVDENNHIDLDEFLAIMAKRATQNEVKEGEDRLKMIQNWLSEKQIYKIRSKFNEFDISGRGYIRVHEIKFLFRELGESISIKELDSIVDELDVDKNGKIKYNDFLFTMALRWKNTDNNNDNDHNLSDRQLNKINKAFKYYDIDRNDTMDKADLRDFLNDINIRYKKDKIMDIFDDLNIPYKNPIYYNDILIVMDYILNNDNDRTNDNYSSSSRRRRRSNSRSPISSPRRRRRSKSPISSSPRRNRRRRNSKSPTLSPKQRRNRSIKRRSVSPPTIRKQSNNRRSRKRSNSPDNKNSKYKKRLRNIFQDYDRNDTNKIRTRDLNNLLTDLDLDLTRREIRSLTKEVDAKDRGFIRYKQLEQSIMNLLHKKIRY